MSDILQRTCHVFSDTHSAIVLHVSDVAIAVSSKYRYRSRIFIIIIIIIILVIAVVYRYYILIMMIDYKNIFYMAAQDGVLYCIILLLLSIHPEITSLHTRTHGGIRLARCRAMGGWYRARSRTSIKRGTVDRRKTNIITDRGAFWKSNINLDWLFTAVCG